MSFHDEVQASEGTRRHLDHRETRTEDDRARRPGRRELDHAHTGGRLDVDVLDEADELDVEVPGPVDVGHRNGHQLELHVHSGLLPYHAFRGLPGNPSGAGGRRCPRAAGEKRRDI